MASFYSSLLFTLAVFHWIPNLKSECLNNYKLISSHGPWTHGGFPHYQGHIMPNYRGNGGIQDWTLQMNFTAPLTEDLEVWNVLGYENSKGKTSLVLTAREYNQKIYKQFNMNYIAAFGDNQLQNHLQCVQFCGILDSGENTCDLGPPIPAVSTTFRPTSSIPSHSTQNSMTTSTSMIPTTTNNPSRNCAAHVLDMGGIQESSDDSSGRFDAHWQIHASKEIKFWRLTFVADKPFAMVRPFESKLDNSTGPNIYRFKNSRNQRVIQEGETMRVGWEAQWNGRRPRILSAVVTSQSLPENLVLCQSSTTTKQPETTAMPELETTAMSKQTITVLPNP